MRRLTKMTIMMTVSFPHYLISSTQYLVQKKKKFRPLSGDIFSLIHFLYSINALEKTYIFTNILPIQYKISGKDSLLGE